MKINGQPVASLQVINHLCFVWKKQDKGNRSYVLLNEPDIMFIKNTETSQTRMQLPASIKFQVVCTRFGACEEGLISKFIGAQNGFEPQPCQPGDYEIYIRMFDDHYLLHLSII